MLRVTRSGPQPASKGKSKSTSSSVTFRAAARASSTLSSLKPSSPSFLQSRWTVAIEVAEADASSLMDVC